MSNPEPNVLIGADAIAERVSELARQISQDYASVDELVLIGVLRGSFIFLSDLSRKIGKGGNRGPFSSPCL